MEAEFGQQAAHDLRITDVEHGKHLFAVILTEKGRICKGNGEQEMCPAVAVARGIPDAPAKASLD